MLLSYSAVAVCVVRRLLLHLPHRRWPASVSLLCLTAVSSTTAPPTRWPSTAALTRGRPRRCGVGFTCPLPIHLSELRRAVGSQSCTPSGHRCQQEEKGAELLQQLDELTARAVDPHTRGGVDSATQSTATSDGRPRKRKRERATVLLASLQRLQFLEDQYSVVRLLELLAEQQQQSSLYHRPL